MKVYLVMCDGYNHTQENYSYVVGICRTAEGASRKCRELESKEDERKVHNRKYDYNDYTVQEYELEE